MNGNNRENFLVIFSKELNLTNLVLITSSIDLNSVRAKWDQKLWSTLDINSHIVLILQIIPDNSFSLEYMIKWELNQFDAVHISLYEKAVNILIILEKEVNHADFKSLSFGLVAIAAILIFSNFNAHISVHGN